MMPVSVPKVPYRTPKEGTWQWVDIWNCLVSPSRTALVTGKCLQLQGTWGLQPRPAYDPLRKCLQLLLCLQLMSGRVCTSCLLAACCFLITAVLHRSGVLRKGPPSGAHNLFLVCTARRLPALAVNLCPTISATACSIGNGSSF